MAILWNSFKPTMVSDLWANSATGSSSRDINRLKKERQDDAINQAERNQEASVRTADSMAQRSAVDREKRMEQIKGEPGDSYNTRMQNQAWNPDAYGKKYRDQFEQQEPQPQPGAGVDEEAEARRKRRISMAMAGSDY